ncbi:hypothetical protein GLX_12040 [Komagataeibacter medellinensis NBRC 3288]|uniref:Uncharacterized protein n=2 Tax=Komagataeibacter medellinensis TaxID=1177712 RepID=G2I669_KOMMN|nr:hypothetical protein GLX_12040 [Komagataeibacter medellinensis NBRC 3288]
MPQMFHNSGGDIIMRRYVTGAFLTTGPLALYGSGTCAHTADIPDTSTDDISFSVRRTDVASGDVWGHDTPIYGSHTYPVSIRSGECAGIGFAHIAGTAHLTGQGRPHDGKGHTGLFRQQMTGATEPLWKTSMVP